MIKTILTVVVCCCWLMACGGQKITDTASSSSRSSSTVSSLQASLSSRQSVSSAAQSQASGNSQQGKVLYDQKCSVCHGAKGEGNPQLESPALIECSVCSNTTTLSQYIARSMPPVGPSAPKGCEGDCTINVSRYILDAFNQQQDPSQCQADAKPLPSRFKRLSRQEYSRTLKDLLQLPDSPNVTAIPDDPSVYNFQTLASVQTVQPSHISGYLALATEQAELLMNTASRRDKVLGCDYTKSTCLDGFLKQFGRLAYRRPLDNQELTRLKQFITTQATQPRDQFVVAFQLFLTSPYFIFRVEVGDSPQGLSTLNAYELAARLAFVLWGQGPTNDLLDKAQNGQLNTDAQIAQLAQDMLKDTRAREHLAGFFEQWLSTNLIQTPIEKPPGWYDALPTDLRAETNNLLGEYVWQNKDFMQVFTENRTYLTPNLANYYGLPKPTSAQQAVNLPGGDARAFTGILGHASTLMAKSDGDLIAKRGNWLRRTFLCRELHLPNGVADIINGKFAGFTPMQILTERNRDPSCERCHSQIDPIGLGFEMFDRSGRFDGDVNLADYPIKPGFPDAGQSGLTRVQDFARALSEMPEVGECIADRLFLYMRNHIAEKEDKCVVYNAKNQFENTGHQFTALLLSVVNHPSFRSRVAPAPDASEPDPQPALVNLALNRPVTTTKAQDGNPGSRLTDNSITADSRWSAQVFPQSATIDLGQARSFVQVEIYPFEDRAYKYTVDISQNGTQFTRLVDRSTSTQSGGVIADLFAPVSARYIRITVTGVSGYTGDWASLREVKILGPAP